MAITFKLVFILILSTNCQQSLGSIEAEPSSSSYASWFQLFQSAKTLPPDAQMFVATWFGPQNSAVQNDTSMSLERPRLILQANAMHPEPSQSAVDLLPDNNTQLFTVALVGPSNTKAQRERIQFVENQFQKLIKEYQDMEEKIQSSYNGEDIYREGYQPDILEETIKKEKELVLLEESMFKWSENQQFVVIAEEPTAKNHTRFEAPTAKSHTPHHISSSCGCSKGMTPGDVMLFLGTWLFFLFLLAISGRAIITLFRACLIERNEILLSKNRKTNLV